jgi:hypothetical protein
MPLVQPRWDLIGSCDEGGTAAMPAKPWMQLIRLHMQLRTGGCEARLNSP